MNEKKLGSDKKHTFLWYFYNYNYENSRWKDSIRNRQCTIFLVIKWILLLICGIVCSRDVSIRPKKCIKFNLVRSGFGFVSSCMNTVDLKKPEKIVYPCELFSNYVIRLRVIHPLPERKKTPNQQNNINVVTTHKINLPAICSSVSCSVCENSNRVINIL